MTGRVWFDMSETRSKSPTGETPNDVETLCLHRRCSQRRKGLSEPLDVHAPHPTNTSMGRLVVLRAQGPVRGSPSMMNKGGAVASALEAIATARPARGSISALLHGVVALWTRRRQLRLRRRWLHDGQVHRRRDRRPVGIQKLMGNRLQLRVLVGRCGLGHGVSPGWLDRR